MGLSEQERKLFEELENSLRSDAKEQKVSTREQGARRILSGLLVSVAGLAGLLIAAIAHQPLVGLGGFLAMCLGFVLASSRRKP